MSSIFFPSFEKQTKKPYFYTNHPTLDVLFCQPPPKSSKTKQNRWVLCCRVNVLNINQHLQPLHFQSTVRRSSLMMLLCVFSRWEGSKMLRLNSQERLQLWPWCNFYCCVCATQSSNIKSSELKMRQVWPLEVVYFRFFFGKCFLSSWGELLMSLGFYRPSWQDVGARSEHFPPMSRSAYFVLEKTNTIAEAACEAHTAVSCVSEYVCVKVNTFQRK